MVDVNEKIPGAPNFTWREFFRSDTAKKYFLDNTPKDQVIYDRLQYLAQNVLQPVRDYFGAPIRVNSGYRGPALNRLVGGSPSSFHAIGTAADIEPMSGKFSVRDIFDFIHFNLPYTELIAEELPDGWVHVALQKGREKEKQLKYKLSGKSVARADYDTIIRKFA